MKRILLVLMPFDHGLSGISVYIREMAKNLVKQVGKDVQIDCLALERDLPFFMPEKKNIKYKVVSDFFGGPIINMLYHLFYLPSYLFLLKLFTPKRKHYDVVLLPAGNRRVFTFYPFYTVCVVHDFSPLRLLGKYDSFRTFYVKHIIPMFLKKAHRVVSVSRSTLSDVVHLTNLPEEKLGLAYPGCDISLFPGIEVSKKAAQKKVKNQWGMEKKFFLFVSRIEYPGKNHMGLLRAYEALPQTIRDQYDLVFVGSPWSNSQYVKNYACEMRDCRHVHFLGFVTTEELSYLYRAASLFIFPSFYEGFGFPVLESMAHGTPVLSSDRSSLLEVGYNSVVTFDPSSPKKISQAIVKTLRSPATQRKLIEKGYRRASEFSWDTSAKRLIKYMEREPLPLYNTEYLKELSEKVIHLERRELFGISFLNASTGKVLEIFSHIFSMRERAKFSFINANSINIAQKNIHFKSALMETNYLLPDGIGMKIACLFGGFSMYENLNGTDLFPHLMEYFENHKKSVYFLGSKPGVVEKMNTILKFDHPNLKVAGFHHGYFSQEEKSKKLKIIDVINKANPDVLMVGMGSPAQEIWVQKNFDKLKAKVVITVGGLFDFQSHTKKRAPMWMRKGGLEWAFRLMIEPGRLWRRYLIGNFVFLARLFVKRSEIRKSSGQEIGEQKWMKS